MASFWMVRISFGLTHLNDGFFFSQLRFSLITVDPLSLKCHMMLIYFVYSSAELLGTGAISFQ